MYRVKLTEKSEETEVIHTEETGQTERQILCLFDRVNRSHSSVIPVPSVCRSLRFLRPLRYLPSRSAAITALSVALGRIARAVIAGFG